MAVIEYIQVSHDDALLYREHEAEGLTWPGWWYRIDDGVWRGPYPTRDEAVQHAETGRADEFYSGQSFERQLSRDARGQE